MKYSALRFLPLVCCSFLLCFSPEEGEAADRLLPSFQAHPVPQATIILASADAKTSSTAPSLRKEKEPLSAGPVFSKSHLSLPEVLSDTDAALYAQIFDLQDAGKIKKADELIGQLSDKILMGHVLSQRYLHPSAYRSKYKELKKWLNAYADHPDAKRIYKLGGKRGRRSALEKPDNNFLKGHGDVIAGEGWIAGGRYSHLSYHKRKRARQLIRQFRRSLRRGHTKASKNILLSRDAKKLLTRKDYDTLAGAQGFSYFLDKRYQWALNWAGKAARRSGKKVPLALWGAGLAAWKLKRYDESASYFADLADSKKGESWLASAGGYWASRAYMKAGSYDKVTPYLTKASMHPRTFYGILARQTLGLPHSYAWNDLPLAQNDLEKIASFPAGKRAFALLQTGQTSRAERELRRIYPDNPHLTKPLMALAEGWDMPALALRLSALSKKEEGLFYDTARYPMPSWEPKGGWQLDRALIYAFVRQESSFNPVAESHAGARGLMQLMPSTASYVARDRRYRRKKNHLLLKPDLNLSLGQRYLSLLFKDNRIGNNLFFVSAAYNGGPGNLFKWRKRMSYQGDPLMFIESLPSRETRLYIERVMTNLWIYRARLNQEMPGLSSLTVGDWPVYRAQDTDRKLAQAR